MKSCTPIRLLVMNPRSSCYRSNRRFLRLTGIVVSAFFLTATFVEAAGSPSSDEIAREAFLRGGAAIAVALEHRDAPVVDRLVKRGFPVAARSMHDNRAVGSLSCATRHLPLGELL